MTIAKLVTGDGSYLKIVMEMIVMAVMVVVVVANGVWYQQPCLDYNENDGDGSSGK